jgi:cobalamin biosynthesis protein CobT
MNGPLAEERRRYLAHCAALQMTLGSLRIIAVYTLIIAKTLRLAERPGELFTRADIEAGANRYVKLANRRRHPKEPEKRKGRNGGEGEGEGSPGTPGTPGMDGDEGFDGDEGIGEGAAEGEAPQPDEYSVLGAEGVGTYTGEAADSAGGPGAGATKRAWVDDPSYDYSKEPAFDVGMYINRVFASHLGLSSKGGYRPFSTADDKWHTRKDATSKYMHGMASSSRARILRSEGGDATYAKVLTDAGSKVSVMKRKLERALLSKMMRGWETGKEDGRLDSRRLSLAARGHTNVFKARDEVPEIDTAVEVRSICRAMSGRRRTSRCRAILLCGRLMGRAWVQ